MPRIIDASGLKAEVRDGEAQEGGCQDGRANTKKHVLQENNNLRLAPVVRR